MNKLLTPEAAENVFSTDSGRHFLSERGTRYISSNTMTDDNSKINKIKYDYDNFSIASGTETPCNTEINKIMYYYDNNFIAYGTTDSYDAEKAHKKVKQAEAEFVYAMKRNNQRG